jgi:hypothetical protein
MMQLIGVSQPIDVMLETAGPMTDPRHPRE